MSETGDGRVERAPSPMPGAAVAELALAEFLMNIRSAGFRVFALVLAAFMVLAMVGTRYGNPMILRLGPHAEENVRALLEGVLLILAPFLICGAARRENRLGMDELVLSKPPSSEALFWGKFLGAAAALLCLIPITVLAALIAQAFLFRGTVAVGASIVGGLRVALPALFMAGVAFALATYLRSAMVAGLVIALPIGVLAGRSFLAPALQFTLTLYHLTCALLGLAIVALVAGWWESRREPERRVPPSWIAGAACLAAAVTLGTLTAHAWGGWSMETDPALTQLAELKGDKKGPLPRMPLRTLSGETVRLSDWQGKPVVLVFWSPVGEGGASEAAILQQACRTAAGERVAFLSVCMTDDPPRARDIARAAGLREPVVWNPLPQFGMGVGLSALFNVSDPPRTAVAGLIRRDGRFARGTATVSSLPPDFKGRPPRRDWERRLHELGVQAFRELAAGDF